MSFCNIPTFSLSFSLPGLPSFPSLSLPTFSLAINIPCPLD